MNCPKCESELRYEEDIIGKFSYPIAEGVIDWNSREFNGDVQDHRIQCSNTECGYVMPSDELQEIFLRSLEELE